MAGEVACNEGRLFGSDEQAGENIIVRILAALRTGIGHHLDRDQI